MTGLLCGQVLIEPIGELVLRPGADHGWATLGQDVNLFADWFDKHLAAQ